MTRGAGKYPEEVSVPMTAQMYQFVELLAKRERGSKADVIRQAIREHLDEQEDVMGSRSRVGQLGSSVNWRQMQHRVPPAAPSHQRTAAGGHHSACR